MFKYLSILFLLSWYYATPTSVYRFVCRVFARVCQFYSQHSNQPASKR